jgi:hypothetical protein
LIVKVGVFLVDVLPAHGGGFSYIEKLIRAIDQHTFDKEIEICFVGRRHQENKFKKPYYKLSSSRFYRFFYILNELSILRFLSRVFSTNVNFCTRRDNKLLRQYGIDILP